MLLETIRGASGIENCDARPSSSMEELNGSGDMHDPTEFVLWRSRGANIITSLLVQPLLIGRFMAWPRSAGMTRDRAGRVFTSIDHERYFTLVAAGEIEVFRPSHGTSEEKIRGGAR